MISIRLPLSPSTNGLFGTNKYGGRYKTTKYLRWEKVADGELLTQYRHLRPFLPVTGKPIVVLKINPTERGDADNRLKAAIDFLVSRGVTLDDRHNWSVTATKDPSVPRGFCIVEIRAREAVA